MNDQSVKSTLLFIVFSIILPIFLFIGFAHSDPRKKVYIIPVSGTVDPGLSAFIERSLREISSETDFIAILEMDTFGGRVDSALHIVDTLLDVPRGKAIAFVTNKAISAGALIALACSDLTMKHNTTIGDCAPITYSDEGPKVMGEKFQSPLRAKFRTLAKRNGYPETLAESMVTAEMEVYEVKTEDKTLYIDSLAYGDLSAEDKEKILSKRTVVAKGELLTMDDAEAAEYRFSKGSFSNIDEMLRYMDIVNYEKIRVEVSWSESFVRLIGSITPILLMIGLAALYTELKAPGFGLPGIIGISLLALILFNQYLVGLADHTELLIIILGIILLGFEVFVIPGFGIAGVAGLSCIAVGMILALQDFVIPDPSFPWQGEILLKNIIHVLGAFVFAIISGLLFLRYVFPKLSIAVKGPYLSATLEGSHADSAEVKGASVGDIGVAMSFLRPSGKIKVHGEIFDVVTDGEFLEKDTPVKITAIKGNRIIVSRKTDDEQ